MTLACVAVFFRSRNSTFKLFRLPLRVLKQSNIFQDSRNVEAN